MSELKRYTIWSHTVTIKENSGGGWCRYEDVRKIQQEVDRLRQYKEQRDELLSANIEKSNNIEEAYSLWVEEKKQLQAENEVYKRTAKMLLDAHMGVGITYEQQSEAWDILNQKR